MGSSSDHVKPKSIKFAFCAPSLSTQKLRRKSKDWLNQDNVSEWGVVSVSKHYKNPTKRVDLVKNRPHHHFIED